MIEGWKDFLIIKTDTLFNEMTKWRGVGGRELVLDTRFDPAKHARVYGEVVAIPKALSRTPVIQMPKGAPSYHERTNFQYRYIEDIAPEVQVGDRIYFHFNVIMNAVNSPGTSGFVQIDGVHPNRVWYIRVRYDLVFLAVHAGQIIPIQGYTLIDPEWETWEDISIPTYSNLKDKSGKPILKPKNQWLVKKKAPDYKFLTGFVRHVGTPLRGDKCEVKVGQKIWYHRNADWMQSIEGKDYFTIRQSHIIGRQEE